MGRRQKAERVLGPYHQGKRWRVVVVDADGCRTYSDCATEEEARALVATSKKDIADLALTTVGEALDAYELFLRVDKQNKTRSVDTTIGRMKKMFPDSSMLLRSLSPVICEERYKVVREASAADTHRNTLNEAKTFVRWCVWKRWIKVSPIEELKPLGKRKKGKPQLRLDEARKWEQLALSYANAGEPGGVAAILTLYLNLRASEIVGLLVRDVDDQGRLLWVTDAKSEKGKRQAEIPPVLQRALHGLCADRAPGDKLFPGQGRHWPRRWVNRICREAKVPVVSAHAMRGLHASLSSERGITGHVIAEAMGHTSSSVTFRHYATPESVAKGNQGRVLKLLAGGAGREPAPGTDISSISVPGEVQKHEEGPGGDPLRSCN
jgi:integrase